MLVKGASGNLLGYMPNGKAVDRGTHSNAFENQNLHSMLKLGKYQIISAISVPLSLKGIDWTNCI